MATKLRVKISWKVDGTEKKSLIAVPATWEEFLQKCLNAIKRTDLTPDQITVFHAASESEISELDVLDNDDLLELKFPDLVQSSPQPDQVVEEASIDPPIIHSPVFTLSHSTMPSQSNYNTFTAMTEQNGSSESFGSSSTSSTFGPNTFHSPASNYGKPVIPDNSQQTTSSGTSSQLSAVISGRIKSYKLFMMGIYYQSNTAAVDEFLHSGCSSKQVEAYLKRVCPPNNDNMSLESLKPIASQLKNVIDVACGPNSLIAITETGEAHTIGAPEVDPACLGKKKGFSETTVPALTDFRIKRASVGTHHMACFSKDHYIFTWGYNINCSTLGVNGSKTLQRVKEKKYQRSGQLGKDTDKVKELPIGVAGIEGKVLDISCGASHTMVLTVNGIYSWGLNDEGQLGSTRPENQWWYPKLVPIEKISIKIVQIACGAHHSGAVTDSGWVYTWGWNSSGQLGYETKTETYMAPKKVDALQGIQITKLSCGNSHTAVVSNTGTLYTWGSNAYGELGAGKDDRKSRAAPKPVPIIGTIITSVSCGCYTTAVLGNQGDVWMWGKLAGSGLTSNQSSPRRLDTFYNDMIFVKKIACGDTHTAFIVDVALQEPAKLLKSGKLTSAQILEKMTDLSGEGLRMIQTRLQQQRLEGAKKTYCISVSKSEVKFIGDQLTQADKIEIKNSGKGKALISVNTCHLPDATLECDQKTFELKKEATMILSFGLKADNNTILTSGHINLVTLTIEDPKKKSEPSNIFIKVLIKSKPVKTPRDRHASITESPSGGSKTSISTNEDHDPSYGTLPNKTILSNDNALKNFILKYTDLRLGTKIGSGAFGIVYYGLYKNEPCAIKTFKKKLEEQEVQMFEVEASLMASISFHKNIVKLFGVTQEPLCLVTEFCENGSLYAVLKTNPEKLRNQKITILKGIVAGMAHLHKHKIIHRDLAARNILLGKGFEPKIADFGLSRIVQTDEDEGVGITNSNEGPLKHMAPECITKKEYSVKSDIWSYAVTLYELLAESDPYPGMSSTQVAIQVVNGVLKCSLPTAVAKQFDFVNKIMVDCLQYKPEDRPTFDMLAYTLKTVTD